jgi:excisionase family DNA binding protein
MDTTEILLEEVRDLLLLQTKEVFTVKEFCLYTGFSKVFAYRLFEQRAIKFCKPTGKTIFIKKTDVVKFLTSNMVIDKATQEQIISTNLLNKKHYGNK